MPSGEDTGEQHYRVLVAVTGGNGGTHEYETHADNAVTAVVHIGRCLHQTDPHGCIDRLHVSPTGDGATS